MRKVKVSYFNDSNTLLPAEISEAEKRAIVNSEDYRVKVAVNMYRLNLPYGKKFAAAQAATCLEHGDTPRFLEVMLALELCGQGVL